jgi:hypothetical protein
MKEILTKLGLPWRAGSASKMSPACKAWKPIVACPKDVTMFQDAIKTTSNEDRLKVLELVDLVHAAL